MRRLALPLLALLALLWLAARLPSWLLGPAVETLRVEAGPFAASLVVSGRIATPVRIGVSAEITARIAERLVAEGDRVEAGELLIRLDPGPLLARRTALAAELEQLRSRLHPAAVAALAEARARREQAERELVRARELSAAAQLSARERERAEEALAVARAVERRAELEAEALAPGGVEERLLRARLDALEAELSRHEIRSPAAGTVLRRAAEAGEVVVPGRVLLELAAEGPVEAVCQVEERQLGRLAPGMRARVVADAFPARALPAELVFLGPAIDPQTGAGEARFRLLEPAPFLVQDMTVSVEVELGRLERALILSNEALPPEGETARLRVLREGRVTELPVRVLLRGLERSAVEGALAPGEAVLPRASRLRPGQRARPRG
ncbi:MAG: efflux RND transporter periplasmic adaptor subunit [Xanthomonadales bacterium]|nr:efflux RND transporter periplasmic adaptor subunit [Xanthomonadales bacterium]